MATNGAENASRANPQQIVTPLTTAAIFVVMTKKPGESGCAAETAFGGCAPTCRRCCARSGFARGPTRRRLSCVMAFGSDAWDRLFGAPRPAELHPFREIVAGPRHAVATPGDLLFHIRAEAHGSVLRTGDADHGAARRRRFAGRRGARLPLFRRPRSARFRRRNRESEGRACAIDAALIGEEDAVRRRQLCHRAEISARSRRLERAADRNAGTHHRPHQAVRHRTGRRGQADLAHNALTTDRRERQRDQDPARQHAVRPAGAGRVRHLFHRLQPFAAHHRADAGEHVRRPPARQLRSLLDFSRAVTGNCSSCPRDFPGRGDARRPLAAPSVQAARSRPSTPPPLRRGRRFARHRFAQRRTSHE
jgi:hypothetical protein